MKVYQLNTIPPEAVVVYCSDTRFKEATEKFFKEDLNLQNPFSIVVPASIGHLSAQSLLPKNFKFLKEQIEFAASNCKEELKKVVLVNHEDCHGYQMLESKLKHFFEKFSMHEKQKLDLKIVAKLIKELIRGSVRNPVEVEIYYASIVDGGIKFEKVF